MHKVDLVKVGDIIYIDNIYGDLFKCEIIRIDKEAKQIEVIDHSLDQKPKRTLAFWWIDPVREGVFPCCSIKERVSLDVLYENMFKGDKHV